MSSIAIIKFWVLASGINDVCPFPTFLTLASIILSVDFSTVSDFFSSAWLVLARTATLDGGDTDLS